MGGQLPVLALLQTEPDTLLHTLYQNNVKNNTVFLNEWFAVDWSRMTTVLWLA